MGFSVALALTAIVRTQTIPSIQQTLWKIWHLVN